ncbi:Galectin-1 [Varanus komodoensis]|uniref:Galectin n=1 Tax=Varanus komodoensis TaxID=61221 RepID=A0A8D2KSJ6_VARKO|nr:galectin-1-like [Varanus komodoensis]KAF7235281.1 Galectin-1 [Varanus komodoensis]
METRVVFPHLSIRAGECIKVKGKVASDARSFAFNLGRNDSDLILHFNPRFESHGDSKIIVCNSRTAGEWGSELRDSAFPFQQGEEAKICVSFNGEEVTVNMNGNQEVKFPNRLGLASAEYFSVEGDFNIKSVKID